jgi:CRISPR-associated endonuclease/helicase Cas3
VRTYAEEFVRLTHKPRPHKYQEAIAECLLARRHVVVRAPTGAGKTLAVLVPFLLHRKSIGVGGMIYVLPLRTLVEAVFEEARQLAEPLGLGVAMQTGERADAEFFHDADIIVTTFDQLLSGLLCDPYGLSSKLWNINAAAVAGKFVVFDEFHLMEPDRAFVSALFGTRLFEDLCVSVWMTATATSPLVALILRTLNAIEVPLSNAEQAALFEGRGIRRELRAHWNEPLTASEVIRHRGRKVLVVVNTVARAQALFHQLEHQWCPLLLHSRFFSTHRREKQAQLNQADLIIATQVIEAGVDISSEVLLTEAAPVNALVQRAGRCARFKGESGTVHVYDVPLPLPYMEAEIDAARRVVVDTDALSPRLCQEWVERAHRQEDEETLTGWNDLTAKRKNLILGRVTGEGNSGAAAYIRRGDDNVRVFILADPTGAKPQEREAIQIRRTTIQRYQSHAWVYDRDEWVLNGDVKTAYAVALPPAIAGYTKESGLRLGTAGTIQSPAKERRPRPGWPALSAESWSAHTVNVMRCSQDRLRAEGLPESLAELAAWTARLHDVGKLQQCWQTWALERQAARGKNVDYALAHTDYDWRLNRGEPRPPKHATASALYGAVYLTNMPEHKRASVLLAVLTHHGGTLKGVERPDPLHPSAQQALQSVGLCAMKPVEHFRFAIDESDIIAGSFDEVWPLVAVLSRILRLSDQKATAESGYE